MKLGFDFGWGPALMVGIVTVFLMTGCRGTSLMYEPPATPGDRPVISMKEFTIGTAKTSVKIATDGTFTSKSDETGDFGRTIADTLQRLFGGATD